MGGGYYDRFLAGDTGKRLPRLGLGYECQREDQLATLREAWDQPLDGMLTERCLHRMCTGKTNAG
jgi:5-formyltetrahydrofolate cyclo-ligase